MTVLAFDSASRVATVAVVREGQVLSLFTADSGLTQSELLLPMARQALHAAHVPLEEIDLFGVTVGPGSFTGVRIGVALVKGLCFGRDVPCAPVSTLEALAEGLAPLEGLYCPVMDARRGQVYQASFCWQAGELHRLSPDRLLPVADLIRLLQAQGEAAGGIRLCGDAAPTVREAMLAAGLSCPETPAALLLQNAAAVARCAVRIHARGEMVSAAALAPVYLRLPQAERERLARLGQPVPPAVGETPADT